LTLSSASSWEDVMFIPIQSRRDIFYELQRALNQIIRDLLQLFTIWLVSFIKTKKWLHHANHDFKREKKMTSLSFGVKCNCVTFSRQKDYYSLKALFFSNLLQLIHW
jgi:hypothetical protein